MPCRRRRKSFSLFLTVKELGHLPTPELTPGKVTLDPHDCLKPSGFTQVACQRDGRLSRIWPPPAEAKKMTLTGVAASGGCVVRAPCTQSSCNAPIHRSIQAWSPALRSSVPSWYFPIWRSGKFKAKILAAQTCFWEVLPRAMHGEILECSTFQSA